MSEDTPPDQIEGAPHPRDTPQLFGQGPAEAAFLDAYTGDRLHHGWLLTGPRGIGKATLAWRIARFLLATPPDDGGMFAAPVPDRLDIPENHPVARRMAAGGEPGLASIIRSRDEKTKKLRAQIVVDDVRKLNRFFGLSAADGGRRVVIVDSADEMNPNAANALLKMLEEPPERTTLLLISHQPSRLLPTIRSRCRSLRLSPLSPEDMQAALHQTGITPKGAPEHLAALADGSVGAAIRLAALDGVTLYGQLVALLDTLPRMDRARVMALAESAVGRNAQDRFEMMLTLIDILLARLARTGATGRAPMPEAASGEASVLERLAPTPAKARDWAETSALITARSRHGQAVNLDPAALVLDTFFKIQTTAGR